MNSIDSAVKVIQESSTLLNPSELAVSVNAKDLMMLIHDYQKAISAINAIRQGNIIVKSDEPPLTEGVSRKAGNGSTITKTNEPIAIPPPPYPPKGQIRKEGTKPRIVK